MDRDSLKKLLDEVAGGKTGVDEAVERLRMLPFEDTGYARIDHHRELRRGFPEVIFCEGKTPEQITHLSFASWNDGPGTFYVDNVTARGD